MPAERESRVAWGLLLLCLLYAALRYVVFGASSPRQLPAWVMNKALALSSVCALALAIRAQGRGEGISARRYLALFSYQAALHVLITLTLFSAAYFPNLYQGEHLSALGELAVLAGVVTAASLARIREIPRLHLLAGLLVLMIHQAALGNPGWLALADWPKYLPPLTLLGFLTAAQAMLWALAPVRRRSR